MFRTSQTRGPDGGRRIPRYGTAFCPSRPVRPLATGLLAGALVLAALPVLAPAPAAAVSNGRIAFASDRDGDMDIYTVAPDGTSLANVTASSPGIDTHPRWRESAKIAFASDRDGDFDVYTMNTDGSDVRQITNSPGYDARPTWSPDGKSLAFVSKRTGEHQVFTAKLDVAGYPATKLTSTGVNNEPSWGTGNRIAFTSNRDGDREIFVMNSVGGDQTKVTNNDVVDGHASWLSDARLVFQNKEAGHFDLVAMNVNRTGRVVLTPDASVDQQGSVSPDLARIAFIRGEGPTQELYIAKTDGTLMSRLTNDSAKDEFPDWAPKQLTLAIRQKISNVVVHPTGLTAWVTFTTRLATDDARVEMWSGGLLRWKFDQGGAVKQHSLVVNSLKPETNYTMKIIAPKASGVGEVVYTHPVSVKTLTRKVTITGLHADVINDGDADTCGDLRVRMYSGVVATDFDDAGDYAQACEGVWNPSDESIVIDHVTDDDLVVAANGYEDDWHFWCVVGDDCMDYAGGSTSVPVHHDSEAMIGSGVIQLQPQGDSLRLDWHFSYRVDYHA